MVTNNALEDAIRAKTELMERIKGSTRRLTMPILGKLVRTALPPYLVFMACWVVGSYAREYVANSFNDNSLNTLTAFTSGLVLLGLTWSAARWTERRYGGFALLGRLLGISRSVLTVEQAIDAARANPSPEAIRAVHAQVREAWTSYVQAMAASGFTVES
jgi:hypothetical protein